VRQPETEDDGLSWLPLVAAHTERLLSTAGRLQDASAPSLCDGWTRGHVLTHVARNAEAIGRLAQWAVDGTPRQMYPGGTSARDEEIERGAGRPVAELRDDVRSTAEQLAPQLDRLSGALLADQVEMRGGLVVASLRLPLLRLRELVFHHVDLDSGFTFADVERELLLTLVDDAVQRLRRDRRAPGFEVRTTDGDAWTVGEPSARLTGDLPDILLWLARRRPDGIRSDEGTVPELPRGA
jgi:maleylpyruvate isomerase